MDKSPLSNLDADKRKRLLELAKKTNLAKILNTAPEAIAPIRHKTPPALSFAQQRMWFLAQMEESSEAYHIYGGVKLSGKLDRAALSAALNHIVLRHDALRTTFAMKDGSPVQIIASHLELPLPLTDFTDVPQDECEGRLRELSREETQRPFDLAISPLLRARLVVISETEHVLLMTLHHIVSDGWSMGVLLNEISVLYRAYLQAGSASIADPLPPLPIQYPDFAVWQRNWLSGDQHKRQGDYWRRALENLPAAIEMPTDRPRPQQQSHAGSACELVLDSALSARLKTLSQRHGLTLYMTLLASWAILLYRLSGQDDIVIGSPHAGRNRSETENLIGLFVNTLALRFRLSPDLTVGSLLKQTRQLVLEAQQHQDLPFEQIVELVQPPRSMAYSPIFQVMFGWQNTPEGKLELPELIVSPLEPEAGTTAKFDLTLNLQEKAGRIGGMLEYAKSLYDRTTIERYIGHWQSLLQALVADENQTIAALPLLDATERHRLLVEWNATQSAYPQEQCIHALFEERAAATPEALAVVFGEEQLSYAELNARANRLAHRLIALGVVPDSRVAICIERSADLVLAMLAVLKAGAAYVPLDPAYPADRLAFMVADSAPLAVLVHGSTRPLLQDLTGAATMLDLEADQADWAALPARNPAPQGLHAHHLAYVIYTSGSTGQPKGVMVEHTSLGNLVHWHCRSFGLAAGMRSSSTAGVAFDATTWEIWPPLCVGASLVLPPAVAAQDPEQLLSWWEDASLDVSFLVTPLAELALARGAAPHTLKHLLIGGDRLRHRPEPWPEFALVNNYGPTETTVVATSGCVRADDAVLHIGRPIGNTTVYLLDAHKQPVPIGVAGEIHIGGAGVARGYLNQAELTAERFIADPFSADPKARLYKSGDLGRYLADGNIEFLGRNDDQVKIRGFRIELGEIEAKLGALAQVREAVVLAREDQPGDKRLVAYVVAQAGVELDVTGLRAALGKDLADYMVPSAYVVLDALPLTVNGKIDRRALPVPAVEAYVNRGYEAPQGEIEIALAAIWQSLLGVPVGRHDNFFELGGHSLLAVSLIERMRETGLQADVRALFSTPTVAELATAVGIGATEVSVPPNAIPQGSTRITPAMLPLVALTQEEIDRITEAVQGGAANIQDIYPLAPLQEGILFQHLIQGKGDTYLLPNLLAFDSRERLDQFLAALREVVARHDILRTAVMWEGFEQALQVVWREAPLLVEELNLGAEAGDIGEQLQRLHDPRHYRIDIRQAPLMRGFIAEDKTNARWLLHMLSHHLAIDHTTLEIMIVEIQEIVQGRAASLPAALPFRNFVAQARLGARQEEHDRFFSDMLADIDEPTAPFGLLNVQGDGSDVAASRQAVDAALSERLRRQARALGVSAATLVHVAWAQVLSKLSGREAVVFGTVLFGRMQGGQGADRVLGMFINTLPLRLDISQQTVVQGVRQAHARLSALMRHEHASLALAQRCSAVAAPAPLFSALLNYRHTTAVEVGESGIGALSEGMQVLSSEEVTNYPVTLSVDDVGTGFLMSAHVSGHIDPARVCGYMHTALENLVAALESAPETALCDVSVLRAQERHQLLVEWNATQSAYPQEQCIHALFEERAAATPEALAVVFGEEQLSYAELNGRANRLAHRLIALGVVPGEAVGIALERSIELIVAELAVVKAMAVYVPLDPVLPPSRQAMMLADCQARWVIATAPVGQCRQVDPHDHSLADCSSANPDVEAAEAEAGSIAYVMYTSGSTGLPKGVEVPHRAIVRLVCNNGFLAIAAEDRMAFAANPAFDATTLEVWGPLLHGAAIVVIDQATLLEPARFAAVLQDQGVSLLWLTVGLFNQYADALAGVLPRLRTLIVGGDALDPKVINKVLRESAPQNLLNGYGPTETTTFACTYRIETVVPERSIPIGRPIGNTTVYLLDAHKQPVPIGVAGEIHIGGAGVARGYLNQAELTAERFIADPFSADPKARLYKSGDLGRYLADGNIEFLGRNDDQVKIRGFRIELGEIEAKLGALAQVREAVVLAREDQPGDKRLVAYVVAQAGVELDVTGLRAALGKDLADYMVPSAYVVLDALPLTVNGKIDRRALPVPDLTRSDTGYVAPRNETEEMLCGIWSEVLKLDKVGIHDDFFASGGHSLLATQAVSQIRSVLQLELSLRTLFEAPTVEALALRIAALREEQGSAALPAIVAIARDLPMPLSFAQQRLWFLDQFNAGDTAYNMPNAVRLSGRLDVAALRRTFNDIVRRHEGLRTRFALIDGSPVQVIAPVLELEVPLTDLADLPPAEREARTSWLVQDEAQTSFDLERGPLMRVKLLRLGQEEHVVLLTMHHIVSDGWSMGILVREVAALYAAYSQGLPSPLADLTIQYGDYAHWQRQWLAGGVLAAQLDYWKGQLAGAPALLELPTDQPRPAVQEHRGSTQTITLSPALMAPLQALAARHNGTLFMGMLTVLKLVLHRWSGQKDMVVGTVIAGRNHAAVEPLIGCFMNFLPLRTRFAANGTVAEMLSRLCGTVLEAYSHQDAPFEEVIEALNPVRDTSHNPIFNVAFLLQNFPGSTALGNALVSTTWPMKQEVALLDLRFVAMESPEGMTLLCEYNTSLFGDETIAQVLEAYREALAHVGRHPESAIDSVPFPAALQEQAQRCAARSRKHDIVVASTFTAEPVEDGLRFWMEQFGMPAAVRFAPYNQVFQSLLDPYGLFAVNPGGANLVLLRLEDWIRYAGEATAQEHFDLLRNNANELIAAIQAAVGYSSVPLFVLFCPLSQAWRERPGYAAFVDTLEQELLGGLREVLGVYPIASAELARLYPVAQVEDAYADQLGHVPYTPDMFVAMATAVSRKIAALHTRPHKVIVLDCDNTLWQGVCGEVGPHGIDITPYHRHLQSFMLERHDAGMLLCLCSKNNQADVDIVFAERADMCLQPQHIVASRINWLPKSENIRSLAAELQLGLDSFIFLDDDPVQCAEVRTNCPDVLVLQVPPQATDIPSLLDHVWAFDQLVVTANAQQRTEQYRQNREREDVRSTASDFDSFLTSLALQVEIAAPTKERMERTAELTQRTNQFNLRPQPRHAADLQSLGDAYQCLAIDVHDRFGAYGLTGVVIYRLRHEILEVDTFLLSCRVLGRGVEHRLLAHLGAVAQEAGCQRIILPYQASGKNQPILDFLESVASCTNEDGSLRHFSITTEQALQAKPRQPFKADQKNIAAEKSKPSTGDAASRARHAMFERIAGSLWTVPEIVAHMAQGNGRRVNAGYVAPRNETEEMLCSIWSEVLKLDKVGIHDDFFASGGHSLLATQAVSQIRSVLQLELSLRTLFEAPTVEALALRIAALREEQGSAALPAIVAIARDLPMPLSFAQQRLWFLDQFNAGDTAYNMPNAVRLSGRLDVAALRRTFNDIVRRHEGLRTRFALIDGSPVQVIAPVLELEVPLTDLADLPPAEREARTSWLVQDEAQTSFDLERGPLMRVKLLRLGQEEHVVLLTMHHIVSDGWSMGILVREVAALYAAYSQGLPSPLADLTIQYGDYAHWQRQWLAGGVLAAQLDYWKGQLAGAPALLELPTDQPRPAVQEHRGSTQTITLSPALMAPLQALAARHNGTLFMGMLTVLKLVLHRWSGQKDMVVGTVIAGRNHAAVEPLIGCFMNFLPLRTRFAANGTVAEMLSRLCGTVLEAYSHQDAPFEEVIEALNPVRDTSHNPIFNVAFLLQNFPGSTALGNALVSTTWPMKQEVALLDLRFVAMESPEGMTLLCEYNTSLFGDETIAQVLEAYREALAHVGRHPESAIDSVPFPAALQEQAQRCAARSRKHDIVVASTFTAEPVEDGLRFWMEQFGMPAAVRFAPYNQVFQSLLDPYGLFAVNPGGANLVLLRLEDWIRYAGEATAQEHFDLLRNNANELIAAIQAAVGYSSVPLFVLFCPLSQAWRERPGYGADATYATYGTFVDALEQELLGRLREVLGVYPIASAELARLYPVAQVEDAYADQLGHVPYTPDMFVAMATLFVRLLIEGETLGIAMSSDSAESADSADSADSRHTIIAQITVPEIMARMAQGNGRRVNAGYVAPRNETEEVLCGIWSEVLKLDKVGIHDDFFASGGHSLLATQAVSQIRSVLQLELSLRTLFEAPTVEALALRIAALREEQGSAALPAIVAIARDLPMPLSFAQQRLWFLDQFNAGDTAYNMPNAVRLSGRLDVAALRRTFNDIVRRHEGLRTRFALIDGSPVQVIAPVLELEVPLTDLADLPPAEREARTSWLVQDEAQTSFDLERGPLMRVKLLRLGQEEHVVLLTMHHIVSDGWSMGILVREVAALYAAYSQGLPSPLADLTIQYGDYAHWQRQWLAGGVLAAQLDYWKGQLAGAPALLELPTDQARPAVQEHRGSTQTITLSPALMAPLQALAARHNGTLFMGMLAVLKLVLHRWSGQKDMVVGTVIAGRNHAAVEPLIGCFMNFLPLRTRFAANGTVAEMLSRLCGTVLEAYSHQDAPFEKIIEALNPVRDTSHNPIFNVAFLLQNFPGSTALGNALVSTTWPMKQEVALLDLRFVAMESPEGMTLACEYNTSLFGDETIVLALEAYREALAHMARHPESAIDSVPFPAALQEQAQRCAARAAQLDYWKEQLTGAPALLELPTDRVRPALQEYRAAVHVFEVSAETTQALNSLGRETQSTLFMVLTAVFNVLLSRHSGQSDICIGVPIANRNSVTAEAMIGFFANTLVLRNRVDSHLSFTDLLRQVRRCTLDAYANQDVPFEHLVEVLKPELNAGHTPLFQVMLVLQNIATEKLVLPELALATAKWESADAKFDLALNVNDAGERLYCVVEYNIGLFEADTIARLTRHFVNLLDAAAGGPVCRIADLTMLDEAERRQLLEQWNDTVASHDKTATLHGLFEQQARKNPEAVAVAYEGQELTYGDLNCRANRLARYLREQGAGPDVLVGICVERSLEMVIGLLGILKAGAAYVPLDPSYPKERLHYMVADAKPAVVLTQERLWALLPAQGTLRFCLDSQWSELKGSEADLEHETGAANLAYVIYTSGSTGRPKGVGISHEGIVNRLEWMQAAYGLTAADRVLQKTPFGFDVSVWEFFWTLLQGSRLVIAKPEGHKDADYLESLIVEQDITTLHFVPSMLSAYLQVAQSNRTGRLNKVICSGEALPWELQQAFFKQQPGVALHNLYGPTEASVDVSYWACRTDDALQSVPIGRPIANTQLYILDEHLNPVPASVAGELYIAGVGLARGYVNRAELTAEKFLPNPYGEPGSRMYKTGDLAKYRADGNIEYLGRLDHQVKIRGFRIELGEIEAALLATEGIREAVVLAREDEPGDKKLVGYVVAEGEAVDVEDVKRTLLKSLPDYMVPSHLIVLPCLPLTPNGKADRKALPKPEGIRQEAGYAAPRTKTEELLAAIWAEVLKLDKVGIHDNFFELGAHSLTGTQVVNHVFQKLSIKVPVSSIFRYQSIALLSEHIEVLSIEKKNLDAEGEVEEGFVRIEI